MNTVETLQAARDFLVVHGWCKRDIESDDGKVCAMGAVFMVCETEEQQHRAFDFLTDAVPLKRLARYKDAPHHPIGNFNDRPKTTFNDVMALYDEAILLAKEVGA